MNEYFVPITEEEKEFYHHGILGMKWGVRRYQGPDGSLTKAGEKRLAKVNYKIGMDDTDQKYEKRISYLQKIGKNNKSLSVKQASIERNQELANNYQKYRETIYKIKTAKQEKPPVIKSLQDQERRERSKDTVKAILSTVGILAVSKIIYSRLNAADVPSNSGEGPLSKIGKAKDWISSKIKNARANKSTSSSKSEDQKTKSSAAEWLSSKLSIGNLQSKPMDRMRGNRDVSDAQEYWTNLQKRNRRMPIHPINQPDIMGLAAIRNRMSTPVSQVINSGGS